MGYEVQQLSWGYLIERGAVLDLNMCRLLSRVLPKDGGISSNKDGEFSSKPSGAGGQNQDNWYGQLVNMTIAGRITLNVWRVLRSEVRYRRQIDSVKAGSHPICGLSVTTITNILGPIWGTLFQSHKGNLFANFKK